MKKVLILSLAFILLLGVTAHGTFGLFSDTETSTGNTFTAWVEEVVCAKFNVSDDKDLKIYKYDYPPRTLAGSFNLSGDNGKPSGVATEGDYVYVLNQNDGKVYRYPCSGGTPVVSRTLKRNGTSLGNPAGLAIDGDEMWVVDYGPQLILHYSLSAAFTGNGDLDPAGQITLHTDNQHARGLAIDSSYLYVVDYATSSKETRFYRYSRSDGSATVSRELAETVASGGAKLQSPAGAMFDGTSLWAVDSGTNKVYEYDNSPFPEDDGNPVNAIHEFDLDSANDDASGI